MGSFDFSGIAALANEEGRVQQAEPNAYAQQQGLAIERQQAAQEKQLNDQKIQQQQIQLDDQKASSEAMHEWDGKDMSALPGLMIKHGASANAVFSMKNGILDYASKQSTKNKTDLENDKALHDEIAGALSPGTDPKQVSDADLPNWIRTTGKSLLDGGKIDPQHEATVEQLAQLPPEQARQQLEVARKGYMAQSQINDELAKKAEAGMNDAKAKLDAAQTEAANYKDDSILGLIDLRTKKPVVDATVPLTEQEAAVLGKNKCDKVPLKLKDKANEIMNRGIRSVQANGRSLLVDGQGNTIKDLGTATPVVVNNIANQTGAGKDAAVVAKQFGMTPDAFDQQAEKYFTTGQLPQVGRGGNGLALQRALMNRSAELHPNASLAGNEAAFKANSASLSKLQTQTDAVEAFESTAGKNIDRLLVTAKNIPDLGARYANIPLRMISGNMIGTENMARFKADLATAQNEAAKVLNSANMTGVLSDSARHELQELGDGSLSYSALSGAFDEIKRDMGNRKQSYNDQIADIQKRMGGVSGPASQTQSGGTQQPKQLTDVSKAREYLQKAGGDKEKARALAKQDGWAF
jgi:hypothetical protein